MKEGNMCDFPISYLIENLSEEIKSSYRSRESCNIFFPPTSDSHVKYTCTLMYLKTILQGS